MVDGTNEGTKDVPEAVVEDKNIEKTEQVEQSAEGSKDSEAYVPNYKYSASQKEYEFDEPIKPLIKSKEVESKLRELYEKGHGIDSIKSDRDRYKGDFEKLNTKFNSEYLPAFTAVQKLAVLSQQKDYKGLIQSLGVPDEEIFRIAQEKIAYHQADPLTRQRIDEENRLRHERSYFDEQNQNLRASLEQTHTNMLNMMVQQTFSRPEVKAAEAAFDQRAGTPGSFRQELLRRGSYYAQVDKKNVLPDELANEMIKVYNLQESLGVGKTPDDSSQSGTANSAHVAVGRQKMPTIPNVAGQATSVVKKQVRSVEELRNLHARMSAS